MRKVPFLIVWFAIAASASDEPPLASPAPNLSGRTLSVKTAEGSVLALVESDAAEEACGQAMVADAKLALELAKKGIIQRGVKPQPTACTAELVANLTRGTRVTVLEKPEECAPRMVKVKVVSGKSEGKTGCLPAKSLEVPASPEP